MIDDIGTMKRILGKFTSRGKRMTKGKIVLENVRLLSIGDLADILNDTVFVLLDPKNGTLTLRLDEDGRKLNIEERVNLLQEELNRC